jgi:hypothetical protein
MDAEKNKNLSLPNFFVHLTNGFSTQTKVATRFWTILALVSLLAVMPNHITNERTGETKVKMPFSIGEVERSDFYPFATLFISILIIGFGSANFQAVRSRRLIQRAIEALNGDLAFPGNIHLQDIFDAIASPSINRIAPLAQILQGKFQFYPESKNCPKTRTLLSTIYYFLLKAVTILVMYIFPAYALINSFVLGELFDWNARPWKIHIIFFWFISLMALLILFQLFISDIFFIKRALKRIAGRWAG